MAFLENRIPPLMVAIITMLLAWLVDPKGADDVVVQTAASVLVIVAMVLARISIMGFVRADTTVNPLSPESTTELVCDGIFAYSRNPMYLAMALLVFAFCLYFTGFWSLLFTAGFMFYIQRFQIVPEERALEQLFGEDYRDYRRRVRRWC
ncbi:MAG: isoprenylcysteine carboxylmethyltransferase family protein [Candidatus Pelagadaptatus aseana]|uniref:methyltransferase family protein n=1 Tax=Candidatus Pelagadaptatus aseana TaxID=3120508 RepID=UPI0039B1DA84